MFRCLASPVVRSRHKLHDHVLHWEKIWRIVAIRQIRQSFVLYGTSLAIELANFKQAVLL